ncbi:hypothetical protein Clacol_009290 [Clathrus columnatus]|uniref:glutaminase n=1 Tax=Clathrus columnatus TaxID=1419009 RepID=A0AAV5AK29_9AGAM|nr:hypothetical protein Clacol_009290 [Clathrus columnatus]
MGRQGVTIGVLALQGAFAEHINILTRLKISHLAITPLLVKTPDDLQRCDALIIPGGESTTIALLAKLAGLLEPLKGFVKEKPVWGTCAGAILLSEDVQGAKKGGQDLLGGINVSLERNGWGSQVESFEAPLAVHGLRDPDTPFNGVFIRAPVILELKTDPSRPPIDILARISPPLLPAVGSGSVSGSENGDLLDDDRTVVALRQGRLLITTFHPELTRDDRFHDFFVRNCVYGG